MVHSWRRLESQAVTQQRECHERHSLQLNFVRVERDVDTMKRSIDFDQPDTVLAIETALKTTQVENGVSHSSLCSTSDLDYVCSLLY